MRFKKGKRSLDIPQYLLYNTIAEYVVYLPLRYNDGTEIDEGLIAKTLEEVLVEFGGFTRERANEGSWIDKRRLYADWVDKIQVLTYDTKGNDAWFRRFKARLEIELKQKKIFVLKKSGIQVL